jgi:DNA-binding NarL/FixJ family response regulator
MSKGRFIWIIDDNEIDRFIAKRVVEHNLPDAIIQEHSSAESALNDLKLNEPEIRFILLDIDMPVMSGWQFINEFATLNLPIPVYVLSGFLKSEDIASLQNIHLVKGFFDKPLNAEKILWIEADLVGN